MEAAGAAEFSTAKMPDRKVGQCVPPVSLQQRVHRDCFRDCNHGVKGRGLNALSLEAPRSARREKTPSQADGRVLGGLSTGKFAVF